MLPPIPENKALLRERDSISFYNSTTSSVTINGDFVCSSLFFYDNPLPERVDVVVIENSRSCSPSSSLTPCNTPFLVESLENNTNGSLLCCHRFFQLIFHYFYPEKSKKVNKEKNAILP